MALPVGVTALPPALIPQRESSRGILYSRNQSFDSTKSSSPSFDSITRRDRPVNESNSPRRENFAYSARAWVHRSRDSERSNTHRRIKSISPEREQPVAANSGQPSPHDSFDLSDVAEKVAKAIRPKHIPIIIPDQYSYVPAALGSARSFVSSSSRSDRSRPGTAIDYPSHEFEDDNTRTRPRHVEISIPGYENPYMRQTGDYSSFVFGPLTDTPETSFVKPSNTTAMTQPQSESSRSETVEAGLPVLSSTSMNNNNHFPVQGMQHIVHSQVPSQSSIPSLSVDESSESEAEGDRSESEGGPDLPRGAGQLGQDGIHAQRRAPNAASLSGLVANVHRTTGKEPPALVGATTTVLGDKLYVFGGRRLSRTKPALTSSLYELDLIRRHWTRIEARGDIPTPRYFHSVCALGDTKLVCYGGMSPGGAAGDESDITASPSDVTVMSDIHIYSITTQTWTKLATPDAPQGRYAHCAAILPSSAVFASRNAPMSAVHHNPSGNNPNQGTLGVALDGTGGAEMVVVGGQDNANHYIEQVSVFNLRSLKWTGTTGMGRSCGAYRSVVTPLNTLTASQIGAGPHGSADDDDEEEPVTIGSGAPMLIYSNYNFLDVKLELQIRLKDGTLTEKPMSTLVSPPGLRFPNGGIIANHFVVSGTFLTSSKQEYAVWALDLRTLTWSRIDAGSSIFSQGSWNRGVVWSRRNSFVILGNHKRSLVEDYNNRRINFSNICVVELEAFGLYENPKVAEPTANFVSSSGSEAQVRSEKEFGSLLSSAAEDIGKLAMSVRELADMDFLAIDGTRVPVNSRLIARRWGPHFLTLMRESLLSASNADTATLRPSLASHPSRNSSITITPSTTSSLGTTLTANSADSQEPRPVSASVRQRLFYIPHTAATLQALLHYLYTSKLPQAPHLLATPQIFCSLLQLARPYHIDGLLEATVERLHESLDGRNAAAVFNAAAMGAGGGDSVHFASAVHDGELSMRTPSVTDDSTHDKRGSTRSGSGLRINTGMANGRAIPENSTDDNEPPGSAHSESSMSESELPLGADRQTGLPHREVWNGSLSAVVGLQKRGLRGLMEGRRMRERGRSDGPGPDHAAMDMPRPGVGVA